MKLGVVGAGSWGTTLANHLAKSGHDVSIWAREPEVVESLNREHINHIFLPNSPISPAVLADGDLARVVADAELVVSAAPSHAVSQIAERVRSGLGRRTPTVVSVSKGLDPESLKTMTAVLAEALPDCPIAALSGPSFAKEVYEERPTAVVAASKSEEVARAVQQEFNSAYFRVYTSEDTLGVELGGALKNVAAIAAGIVDGLQLGYNPRAALITRSLAEMTRLGVALGADPLTFAGLAGLGDLLLTCTGALSRNRKLGIDLAKGRMLEEITAERKTVAEGVNTAGVVLKLAERCGIEVPVAAEVHAILFDGKKPQQAIRDLMNREPKAERWR